MSGITTQELEMLKCACEATAMISPILEQLESIYTKKQLEPTNKDVKRVSAILKRSTRHDWGTRWHGQAIDQAIRMAGLITHPEKAYRRGSACQQLGRHDLAIVFFARCATLLTTDPENRLQKRNFSHRTHNP